MKKDNSTLSLKASLRRNLLREIDSPVVLETHGGVGAIYARCYQSVAEGVVFETDASKAEYLARQRPAWAVYEADCVQALADGIGNHLPINFVDIDPYGEPWPVIDAFLFSDRDFPSSLAIAVNDGLRQKLKISGGWDVYSMGAMVAKYGAAHISAHYLEICRELLTNKAAQRIATLRRWAGYYCGHTDQMTHYAAIFERP